jgi:hypothetical protein
VPIAKRNAGAGRGAVAERAYSPRTGIGAIAFDRIRLPHQALRPDYETGSSDQLFSTGQGGSAGRRASNAAMRSAM